jgi:hypothetical protein
MHVHTHTYTVLMEGFPFWELTCGLQDCPSAGVEIVSPLGQKNGNWGHHCPCDSHLWVKQVHLFSPVSSYVSCKKAATGIPCSWRQCGWIRITYFWTQWKTSWYRLTSLLWVLAWVILLVWGYWLILWNSGSVMSSWKTEYTPVTLTERI